MAGEGTSDEKGGNRIPIWGGWPENFHHFTQEINCYLAGTTSSERPCAAARLIRRFLESDYFALRSLMYRLEPAGFVGEEAIGALIKFLEESPMNKQPSPGAGAKLTLATDVLPGSQEKPLEKPYRSSLPVRRPCMTTCGGVYNACSERQPLISASMA